MQWIREAKGLPVLAHPTWVKTTDGTLTDLVRQLKADGLEGVEVHYSTHTPRQTREYLALAKQLDLLVTGGSDFHGLTKPDIDVGVGKGTLHVPGSLLDKLRNAAAQR
jgi:predicted metal-dependent phosphoesterase TrpH